MPLYEYECRQCGRRVEKIQKFSDAPLTVCPHCAGAMERTVTAAAVSFKGGGWYKDLYSSAKPAAAGANAGASADSAASAAPAAAKTESAPAASSAPATSSTSSTTGS